MKICHVSSCFVPSHGGVETFVYNLCKTLVKRNHTVRVITSSRGRSPARYHERIDGIDVVRYPERHFVLETPLLPQIVLSLLEEDYDVLHVHGMVPMLTDIALLVGRLKRKPVLLTYHYDAETLTGRTLGRLVNRVYSFLMRFLLPYLVDRVVTTTTSYAMTSSVLPRSVSKLATIPCGVDEEMQPDPPGNGPHEESSSSDPNHRVLYVGKLHRYKGLEHLIAAIQLARAAIPDIRLEIVGDGPRRSELEGLSHRLGLDGCVTFRGWIERSDLIQAYGSTGVVVLPSINSRREAFGIVLLEAMAMGKPVIASRIPGPESVVDNGKDGLLVPPGNPDKLAEAIVYILKNETLMESMGECGKQKAAKYSWSSITSQYEEIYSELTQRNRLSPEPSLE